jgi:hypothetical protein
VVALFNTPTWDMRIFEAETIAVPYQVGNDPRCLYFDQMGDKMIQSNPATSANIRHK